MLIDAQYLGAARGMPLAQLSCQSPAKVALDGGSANPFPPSQATAVDPVLMLAKNHLLVGLTGSLPYQETRKPLAEIPPAA